MTADDDRPEAEVSDARPNDPEALRQEIAETRAELGDTVEALAGKADVKARAQEKIQEVKATAQDRVGEISEPVRQRPAPFIAAGAALGLVLVCLLVVRRRRARNRDD